LATKTHQKDTDHYTKNGCHILPQEFCYGNIIAAIYRTIQFRENDIKH